MSKTRKMRKSKYDGLQDEIMKQLRLRNEAIKNGWKSWASIAREYGTTNQNVNQLKDSIVKELIKINLETE